MHTDPGSGDFKREDCQVFQVDPRWPPVVPDHSTSRVARVERALFQVAPRRFSLFVDAHEAIAMALAASAAAVRAPRASFAAPRARADRAGQLSHFPRARVSASAASRLGARRPHPRRSRAWFAAQPARAASGARVG